VGGLTVLHECLVSLPHEDFVYLGDTARFPYGPRSRDELEAFSLELARILLDEGAKLLVVACNSATSAALPTLRRELGDKVGIVGVVEPESRFAGRATRSGKVGLLATEATVASGAYDDALHAVAPESKLHAVACPELAPLIQSGSEVDHEVVELVEAYCDPLRDTGVDTVILGCTHYPLIRPLLQRSLGRGVKVVTSGHAVAEEVEVALRQRGLDRDETRRGEYRFMCTGDPDAFRSVGTRFLQLPMGDVRHVEVTPPGDIGQPSAA
jgi:glutamate racemase